MVENELPESVKALRELVDIPSPSGQEYNAVEYMVNIMRGLGLNAYTDDTGNAVGATNGSGLSVLLVGHVDTVKGTIPVRIKNGILTGRGAVDAKGALMAMVFAAAQFKDREDINITVIGAVEEETSSSGACALLARYRPDFVIVGEPSGWDGICIGYKGHMRVNYTLTAPNMHGGHPSPNAIEKVLAFYAEVQSFCTFPDYFNRTSVFDSLTVTISNISVEHNNLDTTVRLVIDLRIPNNYPTSELENSLRAISNGGKLEIIHCDPPVLMQKNNQLVRSFLKAIRNHAGEPVFKKKTGTSDMNILAQHWRVPMVSYGPGDSALDHTPDEHIELDEYQKSISVLSEALRALSNR